MQSQFRFASLGSFGKKALFAGYPSLHIVVLDTDFFRVAPLGMRPLDAALPHPTLNPVSRRSLGQGGWNSDPISKNNIHHISCPDIDVNPKSSPQCRTRSCLRGHMPRSLRRPGAPVGLRSLKGAISARAARQ
jgi:hypothetical protein